MMRLLAFPLSIFLAASLLAEDELPTDPNEPLDIEPPLLIQEIPGRDPVQSTPEVAPELDPSGSRSRSRKQRRALLAANDSTGVA